jgi:hypothetical protein
MMKRLLAFTGTISPLAYAALAPCVLLTQHLAVAMAFAAAGAGLVPDLSFWMLPLRRMTQLPGLGAPLAAMAFAFSLFVAWVLAALSFRRAAQSEAGYSLAALTIIPGIQIPAVLLLAVMPRGPDRDEPDSDDKVKVAHLAQGVLAGVALVVAAVLVSALTFGAYGWGLFVMTPFLVGITTAYLANRRAGIGMASTIGLVMLAGMLGTLALLMLALEGLVCIILAAPLGAVAAAAGGVIGRAAALAGQRGGKPLLSLAWLPAIFALEGAMPPHATIPVSETVRISAPPRAVWEALTNGAPIAVAPGLVGRAGLAYPIGSRLIGEGVGAERIGFFSTGIARERITEWAPERRLGFEIVSQPPAMEEMSPYRRVHAPHVSGYFVTRDTRFELRKLAGGGTSLTVSGVHELRIDPIPYWAPLARWAIRRNLARVLADIKHKSEAPWTIGDSRRTSPDLPFRGRSG